MVQWLMLLQDSPRGGQTIPGTSTARLKEELGREQTTEIIRHAQYWMGRNYTPETPRHRHGNDGRESDRLPNGA